MAGKSKKAVALVLTAMMAASALAGCGGSSSGGTTSSTPSASTPSSSSQEGSTGGETSTTVESVDIFSDEITTQIKDAIAAEAVDGVVDIKMWCSGSDLIFEKSLVSKFKELYADSRYELKVTVLGTVGEDQAATKITEDPKVGADVFSFADDQLRTLVTAGAIAKVAPLFFNNVIADNTEDAVEVCSIDGTAYAFPKTSDNGYFLYYDKTVFAEEDIATFDGLVSKAAAKNTNVLIALDNAWYNSGFFFTAGCTVSLEDGKTQKADFNTDKGVSAVKAMCHLAESTDKGFIGTGDDSAIVQGFQSGRIKAAVTGTWNGPAIRNAIGAENVGAAKLPTVLMDGEQKQLHSFGGYKVMGVNAYSKFPTASQALAYYLTSSESQKLRYSGATNDKGESISRGLIPTNKAVLETDELKADPAAQAIESQREFSHPQSNVGGKYWTPVGAIGGEINSAKGSLSDAKINEILDSAIASFE